MTPPTLETARLRLRPARFDDSHAHIAMWADERVTRFIGGNPRAPDESWRRLLAAAGMWPLLGYGYWVFADRASDRLIGMGGLAWFARGSAELEGVPEAGWALDADHWGQGLATEAMSAALAWADAHLDVPETRCIINPGHGASETVAARLGFARIGEGRAAGDPVNIYSRQRRRAEP